MLTEDGRRFRRNRVDFRKTNEQYNQEESETLIEEPDQQLSTTGQATEEGEVVEDAQSHRDEDSNAGEDAESLEPSTVPSDPPTQTRSGRTVTRPSYLNDYVSIIWV